MDSKPGLVWASPGKRVGASALWIVTTAVRQRLHSRGQENDYGQENMTTTESWQSGRLRLFAKQVGLHGSQGFESLTLHHYSGLAERPIALVSKTSGPSQVPRVQIPHPLPYSLRRGSTMTMKRASTFCPDRDHACPVRAGGADGKEDRTSFPSVEAKEVFEHGP